MRAVLCGYYGKGNGGDEALLAALLQMLPPQVTPLVLSGDPAETATRFGVEACDRMNVAQVLQALRRSDAFIWGGGSLMQDATSAVNPWYYGGLMLTAQRLGLKTIAWAQGVGPLHRAPSRWLARRAFTGCQGVSVRDRPSAELLTAWGIPVTLAPDPVWVLQGRPVPGLWDLPAPRVAVALRPHAALTEARLHRLGRALAMFQQATQTHVLLVPFQPAQDGAIAQTLHSYLPDHSTVLTLTDPLQLAGLFQGVEMAIAMRLHGLIMAAAHQCRCFAISYDPKVSRLMDEYQLPGWELDQIPDDAAAISRTWIDLYANGDGLSADQLAALGDRAAIHRDLLAQLL
ncbi:polysaccharide pyruvyl transferase CsaB [Thermoleptolyngbya sp. C42_A2020_037]|uniref:polysaccharide pyruvyl transferase CsaB n=1 Tax=Thermoleptolyngbya sp. C42_A2020_037 TaxID=2747799 RepID=UPI0019ECF2F5|nr:polysaccharide pyruvyl transferase CsaB [Thermoleptolyngbya sp. C42_A2020_037]MBF2085230.1 polysaccharide pyruvyl transferase CsaB [Thermoleptolyngbya sp. C42_A2020_037]